MVVQINGKLRGKFEIGAGASEQEKIDAARAVQNVDKLMAGKTIRKVIVVPKLVNFVVS